MSMQTLINLKSEGETVGSVVASDTKGPGSNPVISTFIKRSLTTLTYTLENIITKNQEAIDQSYKKASIISNNCKIVLREIFYASQL